MGDGPSWPSKAVAGLIALVSVIAFSVPVMRINVNIYDEGLIALGAEQILKGHWPVIDFYSPYPPAAYAALALVYKMFGVRVIAERALAVALTAIAAGLGAALVVERDRRIAVRAVERAALVVGGLCLSVVWVPPQVAGAMVFIFAAALLLQSTVTGGRRVDAAVVGATLGMAALWRADFALYAAVGAGIVWLVADERSDVAGEPIARLSGFACMAGTAAAVALPVFAFLVARGGRRAFNSLFVWPLSSTYHATLPWPRLWPSSLPAFVSSEPWLAQIAARLSGWPFYFPVVVGLVFCIRFAVSKQRPPASSWLFITGCGFATYAGGRSDYAHLFVFLFLSVLLAVSLLRVAFARHNRMMMATCGVAIVLLAIPLWFARAARAQGGTRTESEFERAKGILMPVELATAYHRLAEQLSQLPNSGRVFSGAVRHDQFMVNDVMIYLLADKDPPTYYWCLDAAVSTTRSVQEEMVADLMRNDIVAAIRLDSGTVVDAHLSIDGAHVVDDYLVHSLPSRRAFGSYELRVR